MKLFFSYGHDKHSEIVRRIADEIERLSDNNIEVWIDTHKIPRDSHWRKEITEGILSSDSVIAFLSSHSAREESVCRDELSIALVSKHGMIRTVLLESTDTFTPPAIVSEYQWADLSEYRRIRDKGEEVFAEYIQNAAKGIIELVMSKDIQSYNRDICCLREKLGMPEIDRITKFDLLVEKELAGREWLFDRVNDWVNAPDGSQILMLYGKPGTGKSMFSAHIQMRAPNVIAAFPCDCRSSEFSSTDSIIRNIAYRLALRLPDYRSFLIRLLESEGIGGGDNTDTFKKLIIEPLSAKCNINGDRAAMVIVVDALDEMKTDEFARFISEYVPYLRQYVRFLITSRKEPDIVERFSGYQSIDLDEVKEENERDLLSYYESRLGEALPHNEEKDRFIQKLIESSGSVFAYAECVCANILKDAAVGGFNMKDYPLPQGIEALFAATLDRKFNSEGAPYTLADYRKNWRKPLGMVLASPEPIPTETLKKLMNWRKNSLTEFRSIFSTLLIEADGCLQVFHRSFGEWLDSTSSSYAASREDGLYDLAEACYDVYENDVDELDAYMLLYTTRLLRQCRMKKQYAKISGDMNYIHKAAVCTKQFTSAHAYSKALPYCEELLNICNCEDLSVNKGRDFSIRATLFGWLAEIKEHRNELSAAVKLYESYIASVKQLCEAYPDNTEHLREYAESLGRTACIYEKQNRFSEAFELYIESSKITERLCALTPNDPACLESHIVALRNIAGIYENRNQIKQALEKYNEALFFSKKLTELNPDDPYHIIKYIHQFSDSIFHVGTMYEKMDDFASAINYYARAYNTYYSLYEVASSDPRCIERISIYLQRIAHVYALQNDLSEAIKYYEKDLELSEQLIRLCPEDACFIYGYTTSLRRAGAVYEQLNDCEKALDYCKKSRELSKQLAEQYPENVLYLDNYAVSCSKLADNYYKRKCYADALPLYREDYDIFSKLVLKYSENAEYLFKLSSVMTKIASIAYLCDDNDTALKLNMDAAENYHKLIRQYPNCYEYYVGRTEAYLGVAGVLQEMNKFEEAAKVYLTLLETYELLIKISPEKNDYLYTCSDILQRTAYAYEKLDNAAEAVTYYNKQLEILRQLTKKFPHITQYTEKMAAALFDIGRCSKNTDYLIKALEIAYQHPELPVCAEIISMLGQK